MAASRPFRSPALPVALAALMALSLAAPAALAHGPNHRSHRHGVVAGPPGSHVRYTHRRARRPILRAMARAAFAAAVGAVIVNNLVEEQVYVEPVYAPPPQPRRAPQYRVRSPHPPTWHPDDGPPADRHPPTTVYEQYESEQGYDEPYDEEADEGYEEHYDESPSLNPWGNDDAPAAPRAAPQAPPVLNPWDGGDAPNAPQAAPQAAPRTGALPPLRTGGPLAELVTERRVPAVPQAQPPRAAAPAPAPAPAGDTIDEVERRKLELAVLALVNEERARHGAGPLREDPRLGQAALDHSEEMLRLNYFSHVSPVREHAEFTQRIKATGIEGLKAAAENLALTERRPDEARQLVKLWMESPSHRKALLDKKFQITGIGIWGNSEKVIATQLFGDRDTP